MSGMMFTDEFRRDAVTHGVDQGYAVREVAGDLRVEVAATSDLDRPYLGCIRVNPRMDFAPLTGLGTLALLGVPRAITLGLGPRAAVGEGG